MAFNFNWSPLTADEDFYARARDLLTKALNKSPKPPIIVDDILVSEFNLGTVPPNLEILEIGDLAEDRFRGIFKMCYSGDAFLTLKTRVQVCTSCCVILPCLAPAANLSFLYQPPDGICPLYARMLFQVVQSCECISATSVNSQLVNNPIVHHHNILSLRSS